MPPLMLMSQPDCLLTKPPGSSCCRDHLQELNTSVAVATSAVELTEDVLSQFQVRVSRGFVTGTGGAVRALSLARVLQQCIAGGSRRRVSL